MRKIILLFLVFPLASCGVLKSDLPQPTREFRGVWVATVANIDWPSNGNDPWWKKQAEFLDLLDFYRSHNFNAVVVQVRTAGDAFYPSQYAPWSRFLTGSEGVGQNISEDPLRWMIREAHDRGLEFHAWLNPYRATFDDQTEILHASHDYFNHPDWMVFYGNKYYYDPGIPAVQDHLEEIIRELITSYPIDGIHYDDYFYPYKISGETFSDQVTYGSYRRNGQTLEDWRRSNIDSLIKKTHTVIRSEAPWIRFGVSPFGVWRNKDKDPRGSETRAGQTAYDHVYADPLLWMEMGWIDYLAPQIYWSMDYPPASFRVLTKWWTTQSLKGDLYVGHAAYKINNNGDKAWEKKKELLLQLAHTRQNPGVQGNLMFNASALAKDQTKVARRIRNKFYKYPVMTPSLRGIAHNMFQKPDLRSFRRVQYLYELTIDLPPGHEKGYINVYGKRKLEEDQQDIPGRLLLRKFSEGRSILQIPLSSAGRSKYFLITFSDRYGGESPTVVVPLRGKMK